MCLVGGDAVVGREAGVGDDVLTTPPCPQRAWKGNNQTFVYSRLVFMRDFVQDELKMPPVSLPHDFVLMQYPLRIKRVHVNILHISF